MEIRSGYILCKMKIRLSGLSPRYDKDADLADLQKIKIRSRYAFQIKRFDKDADLAEQDMLFRSKDLMKMRIWQICRR